jgi:hypothetical protein
MTKVTQERVLAEQYFGNPDDLDSVGIVQQLVEGVGIFENLYDTEEMIQQTNSQQTGNSCNNLTLALKPYLHCIPGTSVIVGNQSNHINLALLISSGLSSHKSLPINGRSLLTRAQEHIKNGKKAIAIVMNNRSPYKSYASTGNLPSGMCMDDYYVYVRKRMYVALVANTTKPPLEDSLLLTTAIPASVPCYDVATDRTVDEDAGSFVSCSTSLVMDKDGCTADENEDAADNNHADNDDVGDLMPVDWSFPGFITFALLGPIVPSGMVPYRSELLMASLPSGNDTSNGRAALRKNARSAKQKQKDETASTPGHEVVVVTAANTGTGRYEDNRLKLPVVHNPSDQQKIMVAGIAQSKMLIEQRHMFKLNDRIVSLHQRKVFAKKMQVDEVKFMINNTAANDPEHVVLMHEHKELNRELTEALKNLIAAEEKIVESDMLVSRKTKAANTFIDLTIERVLGMDNDVGATNYDTAIPAPAVARTPLMSNKKAKLDHSSESATPSMSSCSTSTSTSARDGIGRIIPQWSSPTIEVAGNTHPVASAMQLVDETGSISDEDCPDVQTQRRLTMRNRELGLDLLTLPPGGAGDFDNAYEEDEDPV